MKVIHFLVNKKNYIKNTPIPLVKQRVSLRSCYKNSECEIENNQLLWTGKVKPTALSKEYTLLILYTFKKSPKVWVIGDELEKIEDKDFPHIYDKDVEKKMVQICLYMNSEFNSSKYLSSTIIPWAIEWLYYYELWLITGKWLGGGRHPEKGAKKKQKQGEI